MCVVSMIIQDQTDRWRDRIYGPQEWQWGPSPVPDPHDQLEKLKEWMATANKPVPAITKEEVEEFRRLLEKAREYDKLHAQPHCESEDKKKLLKQLAEALGVNIDFVEGF